MTIAQKINMALAFRGMSKAELARQMGMSPQNLNQRLKTDRFTKEELEAIAELLGGTFRAEFVFPDGTVI